MQHVLRRWGICGPMMATLRACYLMPAAPLELDGNTPANFTRSSNMFKQYLAERAASKPGRMTAWSK